MKLVISVVLLSLLTSPQGFNDRRILVISALEDTPEVQVQIDILSKHIEELKERKMAVYTLVENEVKPIINSTPESEKFVKAKASRYTAGSPIKLYLIGLDQGIKKSFTDTVEPQRIFEIVDSMPMRKSEMRKN